MLVELLGTKTAYAQTVIRDRVVEIVVRLADSVINPIVELGFVLALLLFFWGGINYFANQGSQKDQGKKHLVWAVVGMAIMLSVNGILRLIGRSLGVEW